MQNLLSVDDLTSEDIEIIFERAKWIHQGHTATLKDKILATLFFESSTRTKLSFQSAMHKLGGQVIDLPINSSQKKGESDADTIKTISQYADVLAIRHPDRCIKELASYSDKPVINAGEGYWEHPTQALLDLYTIRQYKKDRKLTIMFTGDLYFSRTVSSLVKLLQRDDCEYNFIFTNKIASDIANNDGCRIAENTIEDRLEEVDVLYMTRPQKERWVLPNSNKSEFVLTKELVERMKVDAIIMHPLPRNEELPSEIDKDIRAKYFQQVKNGLFVRMAILKYILTGKAF